MNAKRLIFLAICVISLHPVYTQDPSLTLANPVRKCCLPEEFYSVITHECEPNANTSVAFTTYIKNLLVSTDVTLKIFSKKIPSCPETKTNPYTDIIASNTSHNLLADGVVYDVRFSHRYDTYHYCLEIVGDRVESSNLVIAYCPGVQEVIPKCCPNDHFFDISINDCSPHYYYNESGDINIVPFLQKGNVLKYHGDLLCTDIPINIDLTETYFRGNNLCVDNVEECYRNDKFCVENIKHDQTSLITPSAFVCPDFFINKCCPDEKSLHAGGCTDTNRQSLSLIYILKNYRYQIKGASERGKKCSPFTIEDETRSDIKWYINSHGLAVITHKEKTIHTRNFCVDDFITSDDVFPVLKVCSEDVELYHEVSDIQKWPEAVGKCCPINKIYKSYITDNNDPTCLHIEEYGVEDYQNKTSQFTNIPSLVFSSFPSCEEENHYHHYILGDLADLGRDQNLVIKDPAFRCSHKGTVLDQSKFCIDYMVFDEELKPVAIACAPNKNSHIERNPIVASLVIISCVALFITFITLVLMRVRRGMITVKKVNTLAGRILLSYVSSQLIGYLALCIGALVEFQEGTYSCFLLSASLLFFIIASFCWNTSICLEGLLLTMHVRMAEMRRFFYHSLWGWGAPGLITTLAIIKDIHKRDDCNTITPKFGVKSCFFSDPIAQIYYFYLPISLTVVFNASFLFIAKILRKSKRKELEKDPNRIRRKGTIKQMFSRSIRKKPKEEIRSVHSGLRTHHNTNVWIESVKLVVWSGITWILELFGSLVSFHLGRPSGQWYHYLWYFPLVFNCLRGIGIFVLIVLTTDNKVKFAKTVSHFHTNMGSNFTKVLTTVKAKNRYNNNFPRVSTKERKQSVSTIITDISCASSFTSIGHSSGTNLNLSPTPYYHSISQCESPELSGNQDKSQNDATDDIAEDRILFSEMSYCTHL